ncbi:MAG TPA: DNA alkylation repair protein [Bacteroidia bacterium]
MPVKKINPKKVPVKLASNEKPAVKHSADDFIKKLNTYQSNAELQKIKRYFKTDDGDYGHGDIFIGVKMGQIFALAKEFMAMPLKEVEKLLENKIHEVRVGAVSIMDFKARDKKCTEEERKALFDLYIKKHNCINNWDLVDRSAIHVVGRYLYDKPRTILYKLAKSKNIWERRTAIVSTAYFLSKSDRNDTFKIAELLVNDKEDLIQKAYGGWVRQAGKGDKKALLAFLDKHAATMPRTALRYAVEHLDAKQKKQYMDAKMK